MFGRCELYNLPPASYIRFSKVIGAYAKIDRVSPGFLVLYRFKWLRSAENRQGRNHNGLLLKKNNCGAYPVQPRRVTKEVCQRTCYIVQCGGHEWQNVQVFFSAKKTNHCEFLGYVV